MELTFQILIVDDEPRMAESLKQLLEGEGFKVETAFGGAAALALLADREFDLFVLDICMPEMDGFELVERIVRRDPGCRGDHDDGQCHGGLSHHGPERGAYDYFRKPFDFDEIMRTIRHGLEKKRLRTENRVINEKLQLSERRYRYMVEAHPISSIRWIPKAGLRLLTRPWNGCWVFLARS